MQLSSILDTGARKSIGSRSTPYQDWFLKDQRAPSELPARRRHLAFVMDIGPQEAQAMIERNVANRPVSEKTVSRYTEEMRAGRWKYGEAIIFSYLPGDDEPVLVDGQHRMLALIQAGSRLPFPVVISPDDDVFPVVGRARRRTLVDLVHTDPTMRQENQTKDRFLAAAINAVVVADVLIPQGSAAFTNVTDAQRQAIYRSRREDVDWAAAMNNGRHGKKRLLPVGFVAGAVEAHRENPEKAESFFESVLGGEMLQRGDPAYALREAVFEEGITRVKGARHVARQNVHEHWYGMVIGAWRRYLNGETDVRLLRPAKLRVDGRSLREQKGAAGR